MESQQVIIGTPDTTAPQVALTVGDAARSIGIGRSSMYNLINAGEGPKVATVGVRRLILISELERWLASRSA